MWKGPTPCRSWNKEQVRTPSGMIMIRLNRKKTNTQCYNILRRTIEMNRRDSGDEAGWVREMLEVYMVGP